MEELVLCRSTNSNITPDNITLTKSASNISDLLEQKKLEIEHLKKQLIKTERLLEKANHYNEDLRKELETLSAKIHETRKNSPIDVATQVTEAVIEEAYGNKPMPEWIVSSSDKSSSLSIAETVKATIEAELECLSNAGKSSSEKECPKESSTEETQEYIYDPTSGCYYHPATGYYWDSNRGLFYDYTTGTYYQYDEHAKQYKVHSVIDSTGQYQQFGSNQDGSHCLQCFNKTVKEALLDNLSSQFMSLNIDAQLCKKNALEIADNYPPCIRVIVEASEHLPLGSLYIITCAGGSIGREQNTGHAIEICDSNISKIHAEVSYDYENSCYVLIDKGSQNGTFLNSKRMSKSKCTSENHKLAHGDVVEIGSTKLLLHIHKGHETCEECEPGQVQAKIKAQNPIKNDYVLLSKEEKNRLRRNQLKNIKKKYGLQNTHFENPGAVLPGSDYCDKAYLRRKYIGSESNATGQDDTPASVQSPISTENKGHKLLAKMGWKEGEGLGKSNSGIAEPIYVEMRVNQSAGLGSSSGVTLSLDNIHNTAKAKRWSKAQQRFHQSGHSGDSVTTPSTDIPAKEHYTSPLNSAAKGASSITADSQHSFDPHNHSSDHSNQNSSPKVKQMSWVSGGTETIGQVDQLLTLSQAADGEENISPLGS